MRIKQRGFKSEVITTRSDLVAALRNHVLLQLQSEAMMRDIRSRLAHNSLDIKLHSSSTSTADMWVTLNIKLALVDKKLRLLAGEHSELVASVIEFNKLVLACGEEFSEYFIMFDEQMSKMFDDVHERLMQEQSRPSFKGPKLHQVFR